MSKGPGKTMQGIQRVLEEEHGEGPPPWFTFRAMAEQVYDRRPWGTEVEAVRRASHRLAEIGAAEVDRLVVYKPFERRRPGRVEVVENRTTGVVGRPLTDEERVTYDRSQRTVIGTGWDDPEALRQYHSRR